MYVIYKDREKVGQYFAQKTDKKHAAECIVKLKNSLVCVKCQAVYIRLRNLRRHERATDWTSGISTEQTKGLHISINECRL